MKMRSSAAYLTLFIGLSVALTGCGYMNQVRAMKAFKDGNKAYAASDWREAVAKYEDAAKLTSGDPACQWCPAIYFYLANSYDNMYRPARKGEASNDALLQKAVDNYKLASEKLTEDTSPKRSLALEFLVAAYGPDKLADPTQAEPVVQRMIQLEPGEPTNYFALAKIYEDAGAYDEAEKMLVSAKAAKPGDPAVYMTLAGYYNRQGHFDKTIEALEERAAKEPNNPEAFYTIATYYWDEAYRDFKLKEPEKRDFVAKGMTAVDHALQLKPDYVEAIVYKGLLLRLQANLEKDPAKQQQLLKDATALSEKANAMRKAKAAGTAP
jgi:tetratricopeptide (TPR) repeat protein